MTADDTDSIGEDGLLAAKLPIVVVSGLPRSGTSLMMRMLEKGGLEVVTDHVRAADEDNPGGYFEIERVKQLPKGDVDWLDEAAGKAIKVISALLASLPSGHRYQVILMNRALDEVLASQSKMLARRAVPAAVDDGRLRRLFEEHMVQIRAWLAERPGFEVLEIDYNRLLSDPEPEIARLQAYLGRQLDGTSMAAAIDPRLYRNRASAVLESG